MTNAGPNDVDPAIALPFDNLDDVLLPLLISTGARGRTQLQMLLAKPNEGVRAFLGDTILQTSCGKLRISLQNRNDKRSLSISLIVNVITGYIHGEWYSMRGALAETLCLAATGLPLCALCEVPDGFPGADRRIERVRTLTRSTRIKIAHKPATVSLNDISSTANWSASA